MSALALAVVVLSSVLYGYVMGFFVDTIAGRGWPRVANLAALLWPLLTFLALVFWLFDRKGDSERA